MHRGDLNEREIQKWGGYMCMCGRFILLCSRTQRNIVKQLYSKTNFKEDEGMQGEPKIAHILWRANLWFEAPETLVTAPVLILTHWWGLGQLVFPVCVRSDTPCPSLPCMVVEMSEDPSNIKVRQALKISRVQLFTLDAFGSSPATSLTMPCWTCPSFDSLRRCPLPSESSWTTHSEDTSSPSFGPSYTDLQLVSAGEQSGLASGADSTGKTEPPARGLCKSFLVTACHSSNLCRQLCLQNEVRRSHPVVKARILGLSELH